MQVIVMATPVFLGLIALELWWSRRRGLSVYRLSDAISSISLGMLSQVAGVFTRLLAIGLYTVAHQHLALFDLPANAWWVWVGALVAYDFCYYWHHRAGHRVAVFWAAHVVHHQSEDYNLSTALRQTSSGALLGWVFYLPMALAGVPPLVFAVVALIDLLYQYWIHTQLVGKLGWFDRVFASPSNHRVHHAVNDRYLDRNYGGILILWDRLFGSFAEEDEREPPVYGTRAPLRNWNPLWANLQVYAALARDCRRARSWGDKLRVWFKPPGWRPADVAANDPHPPFTLSQVQGPARYDPPVSATRGLAALAGFLAMLGLVAHFLWVVESLPGQQQVAYALAIITGLWAVNALLQPRHARQAPADAQLS